MASAPFISMILARCSAEEVLVLITIDHPDMAEPKRFVNNNEDVVSNGETFEKAWFEIPLPRDGEDAPRSRIRTLNTDRELGFLMRTLVGPAEVRLQIVLASSPDTVEFDFQHLKLRPVAWDELTIEAELSQEDFSAEPYPKQRITPSGFPPFFA